MFQNEQNPRKVARERNASKRKITSFYNKSGYVGTLELIMKDLRIVNA